MRSILGVAALTLVLSQQGPTAWADLTGSCQLHATGAAIGEASAADLKEIGESCDELLVEQDSSRLVREAWNECCQAADRFLKSHTVPPHGDAWAAYRVRLALTVCDGIRAEDLVYERHLCLTEMLFRIPDPRVNAVLDQCSPIGHHVGGRKHSLHAVVGTKDLLLNDESFSKCQHQKLKVLVRKLTDPGAKRLHSQR